MNIPELVVETRKRIASVREPEIREGLRASYLLAARASEVIGVASPKDTTTPYGPHGTDVSISPYSSNGVSEQVAVFRVKTAKHQGRERFVAIPLSEKYEPWARTLLEYYQSKGNKLVFPFTRQTLHAYARTAFEGLTYDIGTMHTKNGKVNAHERAAAIHYLRHIRTSELAYFYGFAPADLAAYCGWDLRSAGYSNAMARYTHLAWQSYFPKLLLPRT